MRKHRFILGYMLIFIIFSGCIKDDEIEFPEDKVSDITETVALFSLINFYQEDLSKLDQPCFVPVYPIELSYTNQIIIEITSTDGLFEAIRNQTDLFHIEGVILPVMVNKKGILVNIETESDLVELMDECNIPGLGKELHDFLLQCFGFDYPINMINNEGQSVIINSNDELEAFKTTQGTGYLPQFEFPLSLNVYEEDEVLTVRNYYELYKVINTCDACPQGTFIIDLEFDGSHKFWAEFPPSDQPVNFDWFINGNLVKSGLSNTEDTLLHEDLAPGEYEICLKSYNEDCVLGSVFCLPLTVTDPCPQFFFEMVPDPENRFRFEFFADFPEMNEIEYTWVIYRNGETVYFETEFPGQGDNYLVNAFEPGSYKVCIESDNINEKCQFAQYCSDEFVVE